MQKVKDVAAHKGGEASVASKAEKPAAAERDWSETLFLPRTDFPMKAGLPKLEPKRLAALGADGALRAAARRPPRAAEVHPA